MHAEYSTIEYRDFKLGDIVVIDRSAASLPLIVPSDEIGIIVKFVVPGIFPIIVAFDVDDLYAFLPGELTQLSATEELVTMLALKGLVNYAHKLMIGFKS